jgi:hypothetical protein
LQIPGADQPVKEGMDAFMDWNQRYESSENQTEHHQPSYGRLACIDDSREKGEKSGQR